MSIREIIKDKMSFDLKNVGQIRDAVVSALKKFDMDLFENFEVTLTIEGKINENGISAAFGMNKLEISKEEISDTSDSRPIIEKMRDNIIERLENLKNKVSGTRSLKAISISFGLQIPMLAKNTITIAISEIPL